MFSHNSFKPLRYTASYKAAFANINTITNADKSIKPVDTVEGANK
jgi:hypothetical protein